MPIPDLNADGLLPTGLFDCTLEEIRQRFGSFQGSERRPHLFARLEQTVEQLELITAALASLRRDHLPSQPKTFAILAEGPLEDIRRLQVEIEQLSAEIAAAPTVV